MVGGIVALPLVQGLHIGAVRLPLQPRRLVVLFQLGWGFLLFPVRLGGLPGLVELIREPLVHGLRPATVTDDTHTPLGRELLIRPVRFIGGLVRLFRRPADVPVRKLILRKMEAARLISHCPPPAS